MRPRGSLAHNMFHLYCIHDFQPNGATIGGHDVIFFKDSATLRPIAGGIDEPLPRVLAHQLAYALSLSNALDESRLMADGTTGTALNEYEIVTARGAAESIEWHLTPTDMVEAADKLLQDGAIDEAARFYYTLLSIPGTSPVKDAASLRLREIELDSN